MKGFKTFALTQEQANQVIGQGRPDFAGTKGKPAHAGTKGRPPHSIKADMMDDVMEDVMEDTMEDTVDGILEVME